MGAIPAKRENHLDKLVFLFRYTRSVCLHLDDAFSHLFFSRFFGVNNSSKVSLDSETMATKEDVQDPRIPKIASSIRVIPDFPKPGLLLIEPPLSTSLKIDLC